MLRKNTIDIGFTLDEKIVFISSKQISNLNDESIVIPVGYVKRFFHEVKILVHKDKHVSKGLNSLIENTIKTYKRTRDS